MLLKELTMLDGVSGNEKKVREYIFSEASKYCEDTYEDKMGNVISFKKGQKSGGVRTAVVAHMDEVGLIVSNITEDGFISFKNVGGMDQRILIGTRVVIGEKRIPGVIGYKPIHLQKKEERVKPIDTEKLYVDAGFSSIEQANGEDINIGTYITFDTEYEEFGEGYIKAKALDDRCGCSILLDLMKETYKSDMYFVFSVREEIGGGGAAVALGKIKPDCAVVVEGTTCSDVPGVNEWKRSTALGFGPAVTNTDNSMIANKKLLAFTEKIYEKNKNDGIRYQYKTTVSGGTDGGSIHTIGSGIPTVVVSVPCRYIHSPVSVIKKTDYYDTEKAVRTLLSNIYEFEVNKYV